MFPEVVEEVENALDAEFPRAEDRFSIMALNAPSS
jgi:hypothetical protein